MRLVLPTWLAIACLAGTTACHLAGFGLEDSIEVKMTPALKEYCHIIRFPQGWKTKGVDQNGYKQVITYHLSDYEFRVQGLLSTWFLVGAFTPEVIGRYDTTNHYRVNLWDATAPVLPASAKDWNAATVVPLVRGFLPNRPVIEDMPIVFNGFQFRKTGAFWGGSDSVSRLSPDSSCLVLSSLTDAGTTKFSLRRVGKVFLDIYSADTGKKMLTIEGMYSGFDFNPDGSLKKAAWLTERYFILPLGEHRDRCLICDFGAANRQRRNKP